LHYPLGTARLLLGAPDGSRRMRGIAVGAGEIAVGQAHEQLPSADMHPLPCSDEKTSTRRRSVADIAGTGKFRFPDGDPFEVHVGAVELGTQAVEEEAAICSEDGLI